MVLVEIYLFQIFWFVENSILVGSDPKLLSQLFSYGDISMLVTWYHWRQRQHMFSSPEPKCQVSHRYHFSTRHPFINNFIHLLMSHLASDGQTLQLWSLWKASSDLMKWNCRVNKDGRHLKMKHFLMNLQTDFRKAFRFAKMLTLESNMGGPNESNFIFDWNWSCRISNHRCWWDGHTVTIFV